MTFKVQPTSKLYTHIHSEKPLFQCRVPKIQYSIHFIQYNDFVTLKRIFSQKCHSRDHTNNNDNNYGNNDLLISFFIFFHPSPSSSTLHFTARGGFSMLHLMTLINSHSLSLMSQISHKPNGKKRKKLVSSFLMSPDRTNNVTR